MHHRTPVSDSHQENLEFGEKSLSLSYVRQNLLIDLFTTWIYGYEKSTDMFSWTVQRNDFIITLGLWHIIVCHLWPFQFIYLFTYFIWILRKLTFLNPTLNSLHLPISVSPNVFSLSPQGNDWKKCSIPWFCSNTSFNQAPLSFSRFWTL